MTRHESAECICGDEDPVLDVVGGTHEWPCPHPRCTWLVEQAWPRLARMFRVIDLCWFAQTQRDQERARYEMTPRELELAAHALGVQKCGRNWTKPYRNRFVCGHGHDAYEAWESLVERGLAMRWQPSDMTGGGVRFSLTETGKRIAMRWATP